MKKIITVLLTLIVSALGVYIFIFKYPIKITRENIWAIGIYEGRSPFLFFDPIDTKNPVISAADVKDVKASFVADPFLFKKDTIWYMFFEVFNSLSNHGDIGLAESKDGRSWKYQRIILDEEYHLSYPYIFEYDSSIYLIPENATADELNLYKAVEFPYRWECVKTLLKGQFGDHAIIRHNDTWWLFACSQPLTHNTLKLFYSDDLFGEWVEHPKSPVIFDNSDNARPGGRVIKWNDKLIRYSQDCKPTYGKMLNAYEITLLTKDKYTEKESSWNPILKNGNSQWTRHGMHHIDAQQIDSVRWIASVDGYNRQIILKVDY